MRVAEPLKSRIVLEMAADLEGLAAHYRRQGMGDEEAAAQAELELLATGEVLEALVRVHTTGWERAAARLAWGLRSGLNLVLLILGFGPVIGAAAWVAAAGIGSGGIGASNGAAVVVGAALVGTGGYLFARPLGHWEERVALRHRLRAVLHLGGISLLVAAVAAVEAAYRFSAMLEGASRGDPDALYQDAARLAGSGATAVAASLLIAIGAGMLWLALSNRLAARDQAESAAILAG